MVSFADELRGSEGEWCHVSGRRAIIRAVHDKGAKVTVQYEDKSTAVVGYRLVQLEGDE